MDLQGSDMTKEQWEKKLANLWPGPPGYEDQYVRVNEDGSLEGKPWKDMFIYGEEKSGAD